MPEKEEERFLASHDRPLIVALSVYHAGLFLDIERMSFEQVLHVVVVLSAARSCIHSASSFCSFSSFFYAADGLIK